MNDQILVHHGIKGQKWGVRRYRNKDGSLTAEGRAHAQKQAEKAADKAKRQDYKRASKNRRNLSDEELMARIGRLEKEKRLRELTEDNLYNNKVKSSGRKATEEILVGAGKTLAKAAIVGSAAYLGRALVSGSANRQDAASYIFPNPNKKK